MKNFRESGISEMNTKEQRTANGGYVDPHQGKDENKGLTIFNPDAIKEMTKWW